MLLSGKESKQYLERAKKEGFAVGAFNVFDYMTLEATLSAAEELGVPVMISTWDYYDPAAPEGTGMTQFAAKNFNNFIMQRSKNSTIPVIIHLDHTNSYEGCMRGIQAGAASVMLDASMKPLEENIALTKKVVEAARACGVIVEGEIGHVSGHANSTGAVYTDVESAKAFVEGSGVNMVAVSIGTVHGFYATEPVLNYERINELNKALDVPLVMHGSSGLKPEQFKEAIKNGISKINFGTYTQLVAGAATFEAAKDCGDRIPYGKIIGEGLKAAVEYLKEHMTLFGTKKI